MRPANWLWCQGYRFGIRDMRKQRHARYLERNPKEWSLTPVSLHDAAGPVRTVGTFAVPPAEAGSATAPTLPGHRHTITWQHFEEPSVHGALQFTRVMWLAIGRVRAAAHRVVHDPRRFRSSTGPDVHIVLQVSGTDILEQSGRLLTLDPGHWAVLAGDLPYTITSRQRMERLVIVI